MYICTICESKCSTVVKLAIVFASTDDTVDVCTACRSKYEDYVELSVDDLKKARQ